MAGIGSFGWNLGMEELGALFGSPAQNADWANPLAQPDASGTSGLDIVSFDDPSAGASTLQGTMGTVINASGEVAGMYSNSLGLVHGFVRTAGGAITNFDAPGAGTSSPTGKVQGTVPTAIDTAGDVTGVYIDVNNAYHGFLRTADGTITEFDASGASSAANRGTSPMAMNDAGEIVGFYTTGDLNTNSVYHGFIRAANGSFSTIDAPGAGSGESPIGRKQGTSPAAINASGEIAGTYVDSNNNRHGFVLSTSGTYTSFDPPGSTTSTGSGGGMSGTGVTGIDTAGDVVGGYTDSNLVRHGYIRSAAGAITTFDVPGANTTSASGSLGGTYPIGIDPGGNYLVGIYADSNGLDHGFAYLQPLTGSGTFTSITAPNAGTTATPPVSGTGAAGVNASGEVVGGYLDSNDVGHGFVVTLAAQTTVATPTFAPPAGTYTSAQTVTISDATSGATIYYTTDGTPPTTSSSIYSSPIAVSSSKTIEAIATASGYSQSAVGIAAYIINGIPVAPTPTLNPPGGTYTSAQTVTISDSLPGAKIYYTTNGTTPTTSSTLYAGPITVSSSEAIEAIATATGYANSEIGTASYVISSGNPGQFTTLVNFNGTNGAQPFNGALIQGLDGYLYGTTSSGGANSSGTIFKVTPAGNLTTIYSFCSQTGCADGSRPGTLVLAANGVMYGTTEFGGANQCTVGSQTFGCGTIFQLSPSGVVNTLHNFAGSDGASPNGSGPLVIGTDGNLYGSTFFGGAGNTGTIFKITPGGNLTTLDSFCTGSGCLGGYAPSPLIQGADGNFYGTTSYTMFKVTPQGVGTTLDTIAGSSGYAMYAGLVQATNGTFYGVASAGGNGTTPSCDQSGGAGDGTVFSLTPGGEEATLYSFLNSIDGSTPNAALIQATDSNLYGTTACGGANGAGTIFSITPAGAFTPYHSLAAPAGLGAAVQGGLLQAPDGSFYGTTPADGTNNKGTVFNFSLGFGPFVQTIPTSAGVGTVIQILGNNLSGSTTVSFNGTAANFTVLSASDIQATVPAGATTGTVTVTTASGTLSSNHVFQVTTQTATPVISPVGGVYPSAQTVTISDATPGATIYYTADGSAPATTSTVYSGPISVTTSETIQAIAVASGYTTSAVASAAYTINSVAATPTFSPPAGTYTSAQTVTISDATPGAAIHYTTDGSTPTTSSLTYANPITLSSTETIKAIAAASGYSNSAVAVAQYTINLPAPDFQLSVSPPSLTISRGQSGTATFTVTPTNGFNSAVTFSCSGLPAEATCTFSPTSVTPNGGAVTSTLTVKTTAPTAAFLTPPPSSRRLLYAGIFPLFAMLFAFAIFRGRRRAGAPFWGILVLFPVMSVLSSCGGGGGTGNGGGGGDSGTPVGTSTVSVSASSTGSGAVNHAATLTIIVMQ